MKNETNTFATQISDLQDKLEKVKNIPVKQDWRIRLVRILLKMLNKLINAILEATEEE